MACSPSLSFDALRRRLQPLVQFLASLKLAVSLLVSLAIMLAAATILETCHSSELSQWYVYHSPWFLCLLGLLGMNVFCAAAVRFPWRRHQTGFVITHAGLLVLLAGSVQQFVGGVEGEVRLDEGKSTAQLIVPRRSQLGLAWPARPGKQVHEFGFDGGPVDWRPGRTLPLGEVDGAQVRILQYLRHAAAEERWVAGETGGPLVRFKLTGPDGKTVAEHFLADEQFGDEVLYGPLRLQLHRAASDRMLDAFLRPPDDNLGQKGTVLVYHGEQVARIGVDEKLGQRVPLDERGTAVQIVQYLPDARPDRLGTFSSRSERPKNPVLELLVHLPGEKAARRQIAFARNPLLNLDGVYGRACPVRFRYFHPDVRLPSSIDFLQTSDGRLHARVMADGKVTGRSGVGKGTQLACPAQFTLSLTDYLPRAAKTLRFEAAPPGAGDKSHPEPAVQVEVELAGKVYQRWLQRNHPNYGVQSIDTPRGKLNLDFRTGQVPLGFTITLVDFHRELNPGRSGNAAFSSVVRVEEPERPSLASHRIAMNEPLRQGRYTIYQSSFADAGHGHQVSVFRVAYDPGRALKYLGALLVCGGIATMFYMRAYFFRGVGRKVPIPRPHAHFGATATGAPRALAEDGFDPGELHAA